MLQKRKKHSSPFFLSHYLFYLHSTKACRGIICHPRADRKWTQLAPPCLFPFSSFMLRISQNVKRKWEGSSYSRTGDKGQGYIIKLWKQAGAWKKWWRHHKFALRITLKFSTKLNIKYFVIYAITYAILFSLYFCILNAYIPITCSICALWGLSDPF